MDKSTVLKAFNNHFFEFIQDVINIFPENEDLVATKTALEFFRKANPTSIIKAWHYFVYEPYKDVIASGDINFFFEKDYNTDLTYLSNANEVSKTIDKFREPVRKMGDDNKSKSMKYIQNLSKLADAYMTLK